MRIRGRREAGRDGASGGVPLVWGYGRAGRRQFCWGLAAALLTACGQSATPGRLVEATATTGATATLPAAPSATTRATAAPGTTPTSEAGPATTMPATISPTGTLPRPAEAATGTATRLPNTPTVPPAVPPTVPPPPPSAAATTAPTGTAGSDIDRIVAALSLEEQVGQLILGRLPGPTLDGESAAMLRDLHLGGVILFGYNIGSAAATRALTASLQAACGRPGLPAIIATDQEGGPVQRLSAVGTVFPAAMAVGATGSADYARQWGTATARELRALGLNTNFAPVLDVNNNPRNPVIGVRSYGERAEEVARLGAAAVAGLLGGGVLATGKHFPGHGDTAVDSHFGLPINTNGMARLQAVELPPFKAAIAAGIPLIMSAHIIFQALDPNLPSTLSRVVLTGLLREQLGFDGVIVSDAMNMQAIAEEWGTVEGAVRFIAAGGDLVEPLRDERLVHAAIVAAVRAGRIPQAQLTASVRRIARAKAWLAAQGQANAAWLGAQEHRDLAATIARDAITLVRDNAKLLPLARGARLAVIECVFSSRTSPLAEALRPRFAAVTGVTINAEQPTTAELNAAQAAAGAADVVVYGTRGTADYPAQARFAATLLGLGKPVIGVALAEPYDPGSYPGIGTALVTYGGEQVLLNALAAALAGEQPLRGKLPVTV